jgi:hypothetical protein
MLHLIHSPAISCLCNVRPHPFIPFPSPFSPPQSPSHKRRIPHPQVDPSIHWPDLHLHFPHMVRLPKHHQLHTNSNPTSSPIPAPLEKISEEKPQIPDHLGSLESKSHCTHVKKLFKLALMRVHDWHE